MVGMEGFEPPTHCSQSSCATRLRYIPYLRHVRYTIDGGQAISLFRIYVLKEGVIDFIALLNS